MHIPQEILFLYFLKYAMMTMRMFCCYTFECVTIYIDYRCLSVFYIFICIQNIILCRCCLLLCQHFINKMLINSSYCYKKKKKTVRLN